MACFSPLAAWQTTGGDILFHAKGTCGKSKLAKSPDIWRELTLPCGQCIGCRLDKSKAWAIRCMHEAKFHERSCFITLTYDPEHLPAHGDLVYRHFQLFCKRLRKKCGKFRFFMCGEYGDELSRPHFHACLFGMDFPDRVYFKKTDSGESIYTSSTLASLWTFGFSSVGNLTIESAAYVARYVCKKVDPNYDSRYLRVDPLTGECVSVTPEFGQMSRRPGIGAQFLEKFKGDVYPRDYVVSDGRRSRVPRYYDKLLEVCDPDMTDLLALSRYEKSLRFCSQDSSPERLRVREVVTRARLGFYKRSLE